jgi:outer membrane protein TolC
MNRTSRTLLASAALALILPAGFAAGAGDTKDADAMPQGKPAPVPTSGEMARQLELMAKLHDYSFVDPRKSYTLPELVNLAQRHNPITRMVWESAMQAAASTGMSESQFYPPSPWKAVTVAATGARTSPGPKASRASSSP